MPIYVIIRHSYNTIDHEKMYSFGIGGITFMGAEQKLSNGFVRGLLFFCKARELMWCLLDTYRVVEQMPRKNN